MNDEETFLQLQIKLDSFSNLGYIDNYFYKHFTPNYLQKYVDKFVAMRKWIHEFGIHIPLERIEDEFRFSGKVLELFIIVKDKQHERRKAQRQRRSLKRKQKKAKQQMEFRTYRASHHNHQKAKDGIDNDLLGNWFD